MRTSRRNLKPDYEPNNDKGPDILGEIASEKIIQQNFRNLTRDRGPQKYKLAWDELAHYAISLF